MGRKREGARWLLAKLAALLLVLWAASVGTVLFFAARDDAGTADAIVVLGAAQYSGRPSPVLRARLDHAIELWRRHLARVIVVTGGRGVGDTTTEAAVARRYIVRRGVPDSVILLEDKGRTTHESMIGVATLLSRAGYRSAIFVSDPFHMLRLWVLAHRLGIAPHSSPTRTSPISPNALERWRYILRESLKAPVSYLFTEPDSWSAQ